jgi:hypothetical protein
LARPVHGPGTIGAETRRERTPTDPGRRPTSRTVGDDLARLSDRVKPYRPSDGNDVVVSPPSCSTVISIAEGCGDPSMSTVPSSLLS